MLRTLEAEFAARSALIGETPVLARLAARLERLLGGLGDGALYLPAEKALLSRDGGVCAADGSRLAFDPDQPHVHRCDRCGAAYEGPRHHRAWITRYHIWLSERAVHLALLGALTARPALSAGAARVLVAYADRYRDWPNDDNVLGPTRPFFSTYLESIWHVQLATAVTLLAVSSPDALSRAESRGVRAMLEESAGLIASFDEGWSNRQVWHGTAMAAAGLALEDRGLVARGRDHLGRLLAGVGEDGLWFEGENYHLFALRGFLLGAELLRWAGHDLYAAGPLGLMYGAPLSTLLPDLTLPARGDAPFGVSVRQARFAELWELGRARTDDPRLDAVLAAIYAPNAPAARAAPAAPDWGRFELAEQEQNRPPARQHRDRLGWKALLWMRLDEPAGNAGWEESALLDGQGVAVLRPAPGRAVMLECGQHAGGHAHPDRLHLSLYWDQAVLADFGTGSYVSPSLHWYRSALAHNAPGVAGRGQEPVPAVCDGWGTAGPWTWGRVRADGLLGGGSRVRRSVLAGADWLLDVVTVQAPGDCIVDLPLHPLGGTIPAGEVAPDHAGAADAGHETGYDRIADLRSVAPDAPLPLDDAGVLVAHLVPRVGETLLSAVAPGPPGPDFADGVPRRFLIRRARGPGRWVTLVAPAVARAVVRDLGDGVEVAWGDRSVRVRERDGDLTIEPSDGPPVVLPARPVGVPEPPAAEAAETPAGSIPLWDASAAAFAEGAPVLEFALEAPHYRRSERPYGMRGAFRAHVQVAAQGDALWFRAEVTKPVVAVRAADAPDPALDNEVPEVHSDGVQVYVGGDRWTGVLALPDFPSGGIRAQLVRGTARAAGAVTGWSRRTADGYEIAVRVPTGRRWEVGDRVRFTVTVNEMLPGRERRAGQLALAGGGWVWLRGDREDPRSAVLAEIG